MSKPGLNSLPIIPMSKEAAEWLLKGLSKVGTAINKTAAAAVSGGPTTVPSFNRNSRLNREAEAANRQVLLAALKKAEETIERAMPFISPSSYAAAWTHGTWDPRKGALIIGTWDPRALVAAFGVDALTLAKGKPALRATGNAAVDVAARAGSKTAKAKAVSRRLGENVKKLKVETPLTFPGQVGWSPKLTFKGYHASNESTLTPNFWFEGWALKKGAPYGFYAAEGTAPKSGFLADRPYVHLITASLDKPMVQMRDIPTLTGTKNLTRNNIERLALSMGADGIIYLDIADNLMKHLTILKTLNPDVLIDVSRNRIGKPLGFGKLTEHIKGDEAVRMFKEYGGESIPEGSINGKLLLRYVNEARERYGLVGNTNITDTEISQALYKHVKDLGGNTAARNASGEPQLLFRGDTLRYTKLMRRDSPEEMAKPITTASGLRYTRTMDNSLGNLFLGEMPLVLLGVDRYLITGVLYPNRIPGKISLKSSGTGANAILNGVRVPSIDPPLIDIPENSWVIRENNPSNPINKLIVYKVPAEYSSTGVNDLNAFVVKTPEVRNATNAIEVLGDVRNLPEYMGSKEAIGKKADIEHYARLLEDTQNKKLGLLKSDKGSPYRDEHEDYSYFAVPNWNLGNVKHILPYDLRITRDWSDSNIYRFGKIQSTPTIQNRPAPVADPLITRLIRLQNKKDAGIIPKTDLALIIRDGLSEALIEDLLVKAYKRLGIEEKDARETARYMIKSNSVGEGSYFPVEGDNGLLLGGISYIDRLKAIDMLKRSGITNPTEADIRTILGHELGHLVETPGFDKEFYTLMGLILDNEGITAAKPNMSIYDLVDWILNYLKQGRLDNGISARLELIMNMKGPEALRILENILRYSMYSGGAYLLNNMFNKDQNS